MSNSGSAYFKHFQAEHLNTLTISETSYYLKESESGSIVFVDHKDNSVVINLPRLASSGRKEDAGMNFKFIFNTSDGIAEASNTITINSIDDTLDAATIISSNNSSSLVNTIVYSSITNGQSVDYVSDGTYWTASQTNDNVISSLDITGVATAATFEPDGDTAADDNAAIGYTAAEGLILTGQGSTSDVTIKNDADATVLSIPTGTTNITLGVAGNTTGITISPITTTGVYVGKNLTISAGSTTTGGNNIDGGNLILSSGGGDGNGTSNMEFKTKNANSLGDIPNTKMKINAEGRVVISTNTTVPKSRLHIEQDDETSWETTIKYEDCLLALRNDNVTTNAFAGIAFDVSTDTDNNSIGAVIAGVRDTSASTDEENHDTNLIFATNDAGDAGLTERMRITHDGNVGIGELDPGSKLDINGGLLITRLPIFKDVLSNFSLRDTLTTITTMSGIFYSLQQYFSEAITAGIIASGVTPTDLGFSVATTEDTIASQTDIIVANSITLITDTSTGSSIASGIQAVNLTDGQVAMIVFKEDLTFGGAHNIDFDLHGSDALEADSTELVTNTTHSVYKKFTKVAATDSHTIVRIAGASSSSVIKAGSFIFLHSTGTGNIDVKAGIITTGATVTLSSQS